MFKRVNLPQDLVEAAKVVALQNQRTVAEQIEFWVRLGRAAEENPDLSSQMLIDLLVSIEDVNQGNVRAYRFH